MKEEGSLEEKSIENERSSYKQIMKATSLFGGVQVFNIIISITRSKMLAILLGPAGMGIAGLFSTTLNLLETLTSFGLRTSAVRDIAAAYTQKDKDKISKITTVFRRLVWGTGLLGMLITMFFAPLLSELTFGDRKYSFAFVILSFTLLFNQLASGYNVILQGTRKLRALAKANVLGAFISLLVITPIYFFYKIEGIAVAILVTSIIMFLVAYYFSKSVSVKKVEVSVEDTFREGKDMIRLGVLLSLSGFITIGVSYLVRIYIAKTGGVDDVGLYTAGFAIVSSYVGLVFSAMGADYYPRLASVSDNKLERNSLINQQAEIAILILGPILTLFFVFIDKIVLLLYSKDFIAIEGMVHWAALGVYFKAISWTIAFLFLAKGASSVFFGSELFNNVLVLCFNIYGYKFLGLDGLGQSFLIVYILYFIQVYFIAKVKYQFYFENRLIKIFFIQLIIGISCFLVVKLFTGVSIYIIGMFLVLLSSFYSFKELDERLELKKHFKNLIK